MIAAKAADPYHHGDLHHALLGAAQQLLKQQGHGGLSLRAVAKAAGVSHAAPYRHFSDKAALFAALAQRGHTQWHAAVQAAVTRIPHGAEQQLLGAATACVKWALAEPELMRLMLVEGSDVAGQAQPSQGDHDTFSLLLKIIETGSCHGVFRQRDPHELALAMWSSMQGLVVLAVTGQLDRAHADQVATDALVVAVAGNVIYGLSR